MNYKGKVRTLTIEGYEISIPSNATIRNLTEQTAGSSTADAMYKKSTVYSVPAGKSYHLYGIIVYADAVGGGELLYYQADTEDATTQLKETLDLPLSGVVGLRSEHYVFDQTFATGKFITIVPSTTTVNYVQMLGYEI